MTNQNIYRNDSTEYDSILFREGFGLQSRELNAVQKIIQRQIASVGSHLFKNGDAVVGGTLSITVAKTVKIESTYLGLPVDLESFIGEDISEIDASGNPTGSTGKVVAVSAKTNLDSAAVHYVKTSSAKFETGTHIRTSGAALSAEIKVNEAPFSLCSIARTHPGIFYFNGQFVQVTGQSTVLTKFNSKFNGFIGIEIEDTIVTEFEDTTLFDQARGHSNYNAPGAHRQKLVGTLTAKTYSEQLSSSFMIISELNDGFQKTVINSEPANLEITLARRTHDESGDYVKSYFKGDIVDEVKRTIAKLEPSFIALVVNVKVAYPHNYQIGDSVTITGTSSHDGSFTVRTVLSTLEFAIDIYEANATTETDTGTIHRNGYFGIEIGTGKAYVKGFEVEVPNSFMVEVSKALSSVQEQNSQLSIGFGNYFEITLDQGLFNPTLSASTLIIKESSVQIGQAKVVGFLKDNSSGRYRVHVTDVSIISGKSIENADEIVQLDASNPTLVDAIGTLTSSKLHESDRATFVTKLGDLEIKTLKPDGIDVSTFDTLTSDAVVVSANVATFTLSGDNTFVGSRSVNISSSHRHIFANETTGAIVDPSSIIISADGQSMDVTIVGPTELSGILRVFSKTASKTKVSYLDSLNVASGVITAASPEYDLGHPEVQSLVILDTSSNDVTDRYELNNNYTSQSISNSTIKLKSNVVNPGEIDITMSYLVSSGTGYASADSYDLNLKYPYTPISTGVPIDLRNAVDFRTISGSSSILPAPDAVMNLDYEYYLPRKDLIVLDATGAIRLIAGIPSKNPEYPPFDDNEMVLFKLEINARTTYPKESVSLYRDQILRKTMRDVNLIDTRLTALEKRTNISLLESLTRSTELLDINGLSRFKTGFLVDDFSGQGLGDIFSPDYKVSIDQKNQTIRPVFTTSVVAMETVERNNVTEIGRHIFMPYTKSVLVFNDVASKGVSVTPYLTTKRVGTLNLEPSSDYWHDQTVAPVRNSRSGVQPTPENPADGSLWNSWQDTWTGGSPIATTTRRGNTTTRTNFDIQSLGSAIIDMDISYLMRAVSINASASGMRPNTALHLFIDNEKIDHLVTGSLITDSLGDVVFVIEIPDAKYRTGDRLFTLTDEPNNVSENSTTETTFMFVSAGMMSTAQETILATRRVQTTVHRARTPVVRPSTKPAQPQVADDQITQPEPATFVSPEPEPQPNPKPEPTIFVPTITIPPKLPEVVRFPFVNAFFTNDPFGDGGGNDPLAQSFTVSSAAFPNGCFVSDIDLFFKTKPVSADEGPVTIQLRPMVNGYPSSNEVIPMSETTIPYDDVVIPTNTDDLGVVRNSPTNVSFAAPIHLMPGKEYCFVVLASTPDYELFVSELGQLTIGTADRIYQQPTLGSSFRSQNSTTWTPFQNEDLMFKLYICEYDTAMVSSFRLRSLTEDFDRLFSVVELSSQFLRFPESDVETTMTSKTASSLINDSFEINISANNFLNSERIIQSGQKDLLFDIELSTADRWTAPVFDLDRQFATIVKNKINNYGLLETGFIIENGGTGYTDGDLVSITSTDAGASGAIAQINVTSGTMHSITLLNPGSGYRTNATIVLPAGTDGDVVYVGFETDRVRGNAKAKYISKPILLGETFRSDEADVLLDINMPSGTDVEIYFRCSNSGDTETITFKDWSLATVVTKPAAVDEEFSTAKFKMLLNYIGPAGEIFTESDQVQCKIVLSSNSATVIPQCQNFRLITSI